MQCDKLRPCAAIASRLLHDFGNLLWAIAEEARSDREAARDADQPLELGRVMGLYQAVSLLRSQADAFGLAPERAGLPEAAPEELL